MILHVRSLYTKSTWLLKNKIKNTLAEPSHEPDIIESFGPWDNEITPLLCPFSSPIISPSAEYIRIQPSYPPETKQPIHYSTVKWKPFFKANRQVIQQLWWIVFTTTSSGSGPSCFQRRMELSYSDKRNKAILDLLILQNNH